GTSVVTGKDFANFALFSVSGTKFLDANGDGSGSGDSGLSGVTIFVDMNGNGSYEIGRASCRDTGNGTDTIGNLTHNALGKHVLEVLPGGGDQESGTTVYTLPATTAAVTGNDFTNFALFSVSGTKFLDANGDGSGSGDSGLSGVTIFVDMNGNGSY